MDVQTAETIIEFDERVKAATSQFYNSAVAGTVYDPLLGHILGETELSVIDLLLVAILSQVHTLVTGPTGCGKTDLVRLVCQGVFGKDGWFLLRLNPHLTEETFANLDMRKLADGVMRDAIAPAPFLSLPCTVLDEINRTPAALTNILLGFCDGRIELKCGMKYEVGYSAERTQRSAKVCSGNHQDVQCQDTNYHFVIGTMNEGKEYAGTFDLDPALHRRFTLQIPFGELRPTPRDLVNIVENRTGNAQPADYGNLVDGVVRINRMVLKLPLDPLATVYLIYLGNVGRCPYSPTGFHPEQPSQELCAKAECRIQKIANAFCPSASGFSEGLLIFLKRAACGLAALRAARTVKAVCNAFEEGKTDQIEQFKETLGIQAGRGKLREAVIARYLEAVTVGVADIKALTPFVAMGGKVRIAEEYVAKHFAGSQLLAMREYLRLTYSAVENFFRQHQSLIQQLATGNGAMEKLKQRLEHAERFNNPAIRHAIEPLLVRKLSVLRGLDEVAEEIEATGPIEDCAKHLLE
jgi:hypothetical protein